MLKRRSAKRNITRRILLESLPVFFLLVIIGFAGGSILATLSSAFESIPGLIIIIPALLDMRGNINGALGSRLGSAWHLGLINLKNIFNEEVKENLKASLILSALISLFAGIFAWIICLALTIKVEPLKVIVITFTSGTIAGAVLTILTLGIVIIAAKHKLDPDNVTAPMLATIGDTLTILCLFGIAAFLTKFW